MANDIKNEIQLEKLMGEDGDTAFSLDLQSNVLVTAQFIFDHYESTFSNNYYNIYLIEMGTFYELFFKYKLSLINRSLIWDKPEQFNRDKHDNALMKTISADLALSYAFNFGWVKEAMRLSVRYLPDLYLPDKAIDLLDEGAAHARMEEQQMGRSNARQDLVFLLITSRSLCVPASGAKVRPLLRTEDTFSKSSS